VTFRDGAVVIGGASLSFFSANVSRGNFSTSLLTLGNHSITAEYLPTGVFTASSSSALSQVVLCATITLDALPNGEVGLAYSDSAAASGGIPPYAYQVSLGSLPPGLLLNPSSGLLSGTPTAAGPFGFTLLATDANGCTGSRGYTLTIADPLTITAPSSNRNPAELHVYVTFEALVSAAVGAPSGTVQFAAAGWSSPAIPVAPLGPTSGLATYVKTNLSAGNFTVNAFYVSDGGHQDSAGNLLQNVINTHPTPTSTVLTSSANPQLVGQDVTFTATVAAGSSVPSGVVDFYRADPLLGLSLLGSANVSPATLNSSVASFVTSGLVLGNSTIHANFVGDAPFHASTGILSQVITNAPVVPRLSIGDVSILEGGLGNFSLATFSVTLSAPSSQTVTVDYATLAGTATPGVDYLPLQGTLTFTPFDTSEAVQVQVVGDFDFEPHETFYVQLGNPANAALLDGTGLGTIQNDDGAGATAFFSINDASVAEGASGTVPLTFQVTRTGSTNSSVSVFWSTVPVNATDGVDYVGVASGSVSFLPSEVQKPISVLVNGDSLDEPNEALLVSLFNPSPGASILDGVGQGTILDDDGRPALCTPVAYVPFVIDTPGSYCLVKHLLYASDTGAAISVESDAVLLDLNGFEIAGTGNAGTQAVGVRAADRQDIVIRNGGVRGFLKGVSIEDLTGNSRGHLVRNMRASDNLLAGLWVEGWGSALRNNLVVGTGGTSALGTNADGIGILAQGAALRVMSNDVIETSDVGSGRAIGIELRAADGSFVERNRISNSTIATRATGILVSSGDTNVMVTGSRLGQLDFGVVFESAGGKYQGNLASDVNTPYTGGSSAGNNQ
jgi:hypothetical protein